MSGNGRAAGALVLWAVGGTVAGALLALAAVGGPAGTVVGRAQHVRADCGESVLWARVMPALTEEAGRALAGGGLRDDAFLTRTAKALRTDADCSGDALWVAVAEATEAEATRVRAAGR